MRTTLRIMRTELRILFCSPIAWLMLIVFAFQSAYELFDIFDNQIKYHLMGHDLYSLSKTILAGQTGVFTRMMRHLYLYIPLFTMGLMSRELSSGSIKLLYSSPVSDFQIIIGKYLAVMVYGMVLMSVLGIESIFTLSVLKAADIIPILIALLGVYLTICAYGAIGLFMSTITRYQVAAAVGTLVVLAVLNFIGSVGQEYDFMRDITFWLSISGRTDVFLSGLLCSQDVAYFLLVIFFFLTLSWLKLTGERSSRKKIFSISIYAAAILLVFVIGDLTSQPRMIKYYDGTATKANTLTPASQDILKKLEGGLTITTYVNLLETNYYKGMPSSVNYDKMQFRQYLRFKPEIKLQYVYYYDKGYYPYLESRYPGLNNRERMLEICKLNDYDPEMFLSPQQIRKQVDLSGENNRFVRQIKRENGQAQFLRIFNDRRTDPSEGEISSTLKKFIVKSPRVGFVTGHGERSIIQNSDISFATFAGEKTFRYSLINQGFEVQTIDLRASVPDSIDIIVLSDMKSALAVDEMRNFSDYVERGGNVILLGEPRRQADMNPVAALFGLKFTDQMLVQPTDNYLDNLVLGWFSPESGRVTEQYQKLHDQRYCVTMPSTCGIEVMDSTKYHVIPLLTSADKGVWNETSTTDFVNEKSQLNPDRGEVQKPYLLMAYLTRDHHDRQQRILVLGDSDCISSAELSGERAGVNAYNFGMLTSMFQIMSYDEFPVSASRQMPEDNEILVSQQTLGGAKIFFMWIVAALLGGAYFLIWYRRRGK